MSEDLKERFISLGKILSGCKPITRQRGALIEITRKRESSIRHKFQDQLRCFAGFLWFEVVNAVFEGNQPDVGRVV
jgi:hypothetical protein